LAVTEYHFRYIQLVKAEITSLLGEISYKALKALGLGKK
jgi:hypothetical protein